MTQKFDTDQENFWAGNFGNEYSQRNVGDSIVASNIALFSKILHQCNDIKTIIEFGSNIGLNLKAINALLPHCNLSAVEINKLAVEELSKLGLLEKIYHQSAINFEEEQKWDLTFVKGVLIHINPDELPNIYNSLYNHSNKYVLIAEYYNPNPAEVNYRGHADRLFKRNFAGEFMERFTDVTLVDYGFVWKDDPVFPQDDITWFLMEKK